MPAILTRSKVPGIVSVCRVLAIGLRELYRSQASTSEAFPPMLGPADCFSVRTRRRKSYKPSAEKMLRTVMMKANPSKGHRYQLGLVANRTLNQLERAGRMQMVATATTKKGHSLSRKVHCKAWSKSILMTCLPMYLQTNKK